MAGGNRKKDEGNKNGYNCLTLATIIVDGAHGHFEIRSTLLLDLISQWMDFETIQTRNKLVGGFLRPVFWVNHEEHVWESRSKIRSICVVVA